MSKWVTKWKDEIAIEPSMPGVWKRKAGGFHIRARVRDPRTGKRREINNVLAKCRTAKVAYRTLQDRVAKIVNQEAVDDYAIPRFDDWAATLFERKVNAGVIRSASGREKWLSHLTLHLIPAFGELYLDKIRVRDIELWKQRKLAPKIKVGKLSPNTANARLATLRAIIGPAVKEFEMARDPIGAVDDFPTDTWHTYTEEEPNSLRPEDVPRFLGAMERLYPHHYGFVLLGFSTGLRPSTLRPLRRRGPQADVKWDDGLLLVRRSHTRKSEVMETTKTSRHQALCLPDALMAELRAHVARLGECYAPGRELTLDYPAMRESDLLFPATNGGFRSSSCLDKPFQRVCKAIELPYKLTPKGMRRTFQDLARSAGVQDIVTRAISGHATETMQRHYSTVRGPEVKAAIAKILDFPTNKARGGARGGAPRNDKRPAGREASTVAESLG